MAKQKIVWKDLPKRYGLFTKRNTKMTDVLTGGAVTYFSSNVKLNMVQYAIYNGVMYFRTETARQQDLNLAVKASSFVLPPELASLAPSDSLSKSKKVQKSSVLKTRNVAKHTANKAQKTLKTPKCQTALKSEERLSDDRKRGIKEAFRRFFRRSKKSK